MEAGDLDKEIEVEVGGRTPRAEDIPPEEPAGPPRGGGGGGAGPLDPGASLQDTESRTPIRGTMPFVLPEFEPICYWWVCCDAADPEHMAEYRGLTRSESFAHFFYRLGLEDFQRKLLEGKIDGVNALVGEAMLMVMRRKMNVAYNEVYDRCRRDIFETLAQSDMGIPRERLEEILGVDAHALA